MKKIAPWLLIFPSVIIGILLVELFVRLFMPAMARSEGPSKNFNRVIFFDDRDSIFENHGDIFTFVAHDEIRNLTAILSDDDFTVEYDYRFRTNNLGLVQDADAAPGPDSLLLLGDSFTEGMGAEPWFRLVSPEIARLGYQPVNGGLLGTGWQQWLKLERYLAAENLRIRKLVVLFISDDYHRPVWNFTPGALRCLSVLATCRPEESFFYRLPPGDAVPAWIAKVRAARAPMLRKIALNARAAALLPASYHVYKYFSSRLRMRIDHGTLDRAEQQSRAAIAELIRLYGSDNVLFMHLPQKDEPDHPNETGIMEQAAIRQAGGRLVDGFKSCRMTPADYYPNDDHPNNSGYAKIAVCVSSAIKQVMPDAR